MQICYHGTSEENANSIQKNGFNHGSWFAKNLQDALAFGGSYIFEVAFEKPLPDHWQFHAEIVIPPERIVSQKVYTQKLIFENSELRNKVFESNLGTDENKEKHNG